MADIFWGENTITHPFYQSAKDLSDISVMKVSFKIVLNLNLKTLIYNGQNDFIVPTVGVLAYMNTLEWKYSK